MRGFGSNDPMQSRRYSSGYGQSGYGQSGYNRNSSYGGFGQRSSYSGYGQGSYDQFDNQSQSTSRTQSAQKKKQKVLRCENVQFDDCCLVGRYVNVKTGEEIVV